MLKVSEEKFIEELKKYRKELDDVQSLQGFDTLINKLKSLVKCSLGNIPPQFEELLSNGSLIDEIVVFFNKTEMTEDEKQVRLVYKRDNAINKLNIILNNFELGVLTMTSKHNKTEINYTQNISGNYNGQTLVNSKVENGNLSVNNNENKPKDFWYKLGILSKILKAIKDFWQLIVGLGIGGLLVKFWSNILLAFVYLKGLF